jgi:hypothetical protein
VLLLAYGVEGEAEFKSAGEAHHESIKRETWLWIPQQQQQQVINEDLAEAELKEHRQSL